MGFYELFFICFGILIGVVVGWIGNIFRTRRYLRKCAENDPEIWKIIEKLRKR